MSPWETAPHSIAHGILDDETYDWVAVVEGTLRSGGYPIVVPEETLSLANRMARELTQIPVDPTGSAGLAGLIACPDRKTNERAIVVFSGVDRDGQSTD